MKSRKLLCAVLLIGLTLTACSSSEKSSSDSNDTRDASSSVPQVYPSEIKDDASDLPREQGFAYSEIKRLYSTKAYEAALIRINDFERRFPKSQKSTQVYNLEGLIYFLQHKNLQAINQFNIALQMNRDSRYQSYLNYNLAAAQLEAGQLAAAEKTLGKSDLNHFDASTRLKHHYLLSRIHFKNGKHADALSEVLIASEVLRYVRETPAAKNNIDDMLRKQMDRSLQKADDLPQLRQTYLNHQKSPLADEVLFKLGTLAFKLNQTGNAESFFRILVKEYPNSERYQTASNYLRTIQGSGNADAATVGALLPLSGKFAQIGENELQAIELAFGIYSGQAGAKEKTPVNSTVSLVIADSGSTPEEAVKALEKLYYQDHVISVIGPLGSKELEPVAKRAQELGIPLISLAQAKSLLGDYVFDSGNSPESQTQEIARYAVEKLGLKKFAIMHPTNRLGQTLSQVFWNTVEELGGTIVGVESYPPEETDFTVPVDKLSGLYYTEARQKELDALAKLRAENKITKKTSKTEQYYKLPPIVNYEAVFIPDNDKIVGQIIPTFAYRDVERVQFLGIAIWNSPELIRRAGHHANGAMFVDAFYPKSESRNISSFVNDFKNSFGRAPSALEAFAYDAASILDKTLLVSGDSPSRQEVRDSLQRTQNFPGVTGKINYFKGQFARELKVLTVQDGKITEVN